MTATSKPAQWLVLYEKADGSGTVAYDSAYTPEQAKRAASACYRRHGAGRIVEAKDVPPGSLTT